MAGAAKKWFIGCGIGCGLFLLIMGGIGTVSYLGIRKAMDKGEEIEGGFEELRIAYGDPSDFVPEPDGAVPAGRMITFLEARDAMAADRQEIGDILRTLDGEEVGGSKPNFIQKAKAGIQLIPGLMGFVDFRNHALLTQGMGLGEYLYIYSLSYYNLLGKDPADGPSFQISGDDDEENAGIRWNTETTEGGDESVRRNRAVDIRRYLHGVQLQMARNQLVELDRLGDLAGFREQLILEIATMEDEPLRLLWETGLPEALRWSLETYSSQLEATYDPMVNALESGLVEID